MLMAASKTKRNLFQNQRSDAAGGVSIKALARQVTVKFKVRFFIGRGGNKPSKGAYI